MKHFLPFLLIVSLVIFKIQPYKAGTVNPAYAQKVAEVYFNQHTALAVQSSALAYTEVSTQGDTLYYAFNINNQGGFIIISANDATHPVLGYNTTGQFTIPATTSVIGGWLQKRKVELTAIKANQLAPTPEITTEWNTYHAGKINTSNPTVLSSSIIGPYTTTTWNQSTYYNTDCPNKSLTGCVATTMAQIMKYWSYPTTGKGSHSYCDCTPTFSTNNGTLSANFGTTTYSWSSMPNNVTSTNAAVATLMFQCGVSVDMNYGTQESSAAVITADDTVCAQIAYVKYFSYDSTIIRGLSRQSYNDTTWQNLLVYDLTKGRVIQYTGDSSTSGHTWVMDGYNPSDGYFHMNWGWSGLDNGYYSINGLGKVDGYDFNLGQEALIGIQPVYANPPVSDFISNTYYQCGSGAVTFKDQSTNYPTTWAWSFPGGSPSTSTAQNPTITYSTPGTYSVTLTASNSYGTGTPITKTSYITIYSNEVATACTPQTKNLTTDYGIGILNVTLNAINNSTGDAVQDGGYKNYTCVASTVLKPSTTYTINVTVGTGNKENLNVYIDYNNNGVFTDAGEELFTVTGVQGLQTKTFTTPASPTLGKYLRMRVIDDYGTSIASCTAPSYGQVEDYAIEFAATPVASFKANDTTICTGANVQFTDQSTNLPTTWAWSFKGGTPDTSNAENPLIAYTTPGTYAVTLVASNTAGSTSITKYSYITVHSNPSVATTLAGDSATAEVTNGTPSYTYSWSNGSQSYKDLNLATGTYTVTVKDANGCQNAASVAVISTGISNVDPSLSFSVYPNPFTDNATIVLATPPAGPINIELFDITGQKVQTICSSKVVSANATFQLNGSGLERGIYFLRLSNSQSTKVVKVVVGN